MRTSCSRTRYLPIIASVLLSTLGPVLASAQTCVSCLTGVTDNGTSYLNPTPQVGVVSAWNETGSYTVRYCGCLDTEYPYSIDETGQATVAQDCAEASGCYITTEQEPTVCGPIFEAPSSDANGWSVTTIPQTFFNAETAACADGDENSFGYCTANYWEVGTCEQGTPDIHEYSGQGACSATTATCDGSCSSDSDCPGGLVCMGGWCGCSDICDDPSCDPNYYSDCVNNSCTDVCDPNCGSYYDACACYGGSYCGGGGDGGGGGGSYCDTDPWDCTECWDYEDCYYYSRNNLTPFLPVGVTLASVLPFIFDIRRKHPGADVHE